jgi:hypothetical protein
MTQTLADIPMKATLTDDAMQMSGNSPTFRTKNSLQGVALQCPLRLLFLFNPLLFAGCTNTFSNWCKIGF